MRALQVVIVARTIKVGGHGRDPVAVLILRAIGLAELDPCDLGDGIPFVRRLQRAGQQAVFGDRLRGELGIDAGRAEKQKPFHIRRVRRRADIGFDLQVLQQEIDRIVIVGLDAAHLGGGHDNGIGPGILHPFVHRVLIGEVHNIAPCGDHLAVFRCQTAHNSTAHHAAMARDPDTLAGQIVAHTVPPAQ